MLRNLNTKHGTSSHRIMTMSVKRAGRDPGPTGRSRPDGSKRYPPVEPPPEPEKKHPPIRPPARDPQPEPIKDPPVPPQPGKDPDNEPAPIGDPPNKSDQPIRMNADLGCTGRQCSESRDAFRPSGDNEERFVMEPMNERRT